MAHSDPINPTQLAVLKWVADGCPDALDQRLVARSFVILAHDLEPTGSGGYTLHEAALVSEFMNLAPVLQRVADMAEKATDIEQAEGPDRELTVLAWANHVVAFARYMRDESRRPTELMAVGPVGYGSRQWERIVDHRRGQLAGQTTSKPLNMALHFSAKD